MAERMRSIRSLLFLVMMSVGVAIGGPASPQGNKACDVSRLHGLIGQKYSLERAEEARRASGANAVRPIGPDFPSTTDFRRQRLNLEVNEHGIVTGVRCG